MRKFTYFYSLLLTALFLLPWSGMKAETLICSNSTSYSTEYAPVNGRKANNYLFCQMIYKSTEMTAMKDKKITKLTFYVSSSYRPSYTWSGMEVRLMEISTSKGSFSSDSDWQDLSDATLVYSGTMDATGSNYLLEITLTTPFVYSGNNLLVDVRSTVKTNTSSNKCKFYGSFVSNTVLWDYNGSNSYSTYSARNSTCPKLQFTFEEAGPTCTNPTGVTATAASASSATIAWTDNAASAWQVRTSSDGGGSWGEPISASTNPFTLSGLTEGTTYNVQVRANCGEGEENKSDWVNAASTVTPVSCPSVTEVNLSSKVYNGVTVNWATSAPVNCDVRFKEAGDADWTSAGTNMEGTFKAISGLVVGKTYSFQVKPNCGDDATWVPAGETYTPSFPVPVPSVSGQTDAQATVSWSALLDNPNYKYIRVAAGSAAPDATAWAAAASTDQVSVTLTGLAGGTSYDVYVRAAYASGEGEPATVNFTTGKIAPTDLVQGATTTSSIAISWSYAGAATQFQWRSSKPGSDWSTPISVTNAVETGLSDGESYTFDVRAYYADGIYSSLLTGSFATACAAKSLPYSCGFENSDEDAFANNGYNNCWKKIGSPYASTTSTYRHAGSRGLYIGGTEEQYAILPEFADAIKGMQISFWYKNYFPGSYASTLTLGSMTDPTDKTTFTAIKTLEANGSFVQIVEQSLASAGTNDHYIAFRYTGEKTYSAVALDDITVTALPSCPKPTDVIIPAANITATSAQVSWTENGSATAWKLQTSNDGTSWGAEIAADANPFMLTGLIPNMTTYYVRVKADCGGGDESDWSNVSAPFQTKCAAVAPLGYEEGFEDFTTGSYASTGLLCWAELNAAHSYGTYPQMYVNNNSTYVQTGSKSLYFVSSSSKYIYAILPEFSGSYAGLQLTFSHKEESASSSGYITLGYMTDIADASTFTAITATAYTRAQSWNSETENISSVPTGARLAFRYGGASNNYYAGIDDISITAIPSCAEPTTVTVYDVTNNEAKVSWVSEAAAFALQYKKTTDADWTDATGTIESPYTLSGLASNETSYLIQVKAICGVGDESQWVISDPFATECSANTVTELDAWNENFESQTVGAKPACWTMPAANTNYEYAKVNDTHANEGSNCLDIQVNSSYTKIIALPDFTEEAKNLKISFDYNNGSTSTNYGPLEVGYYTSGNVFFNVKTLNRVDSYTASGDIEMPKTTPAGSHIAFRVVGSKTGSSYYSHSYIDNIVVIKKPSCAAPTGLAASATSDGANVSWTDDAASEWNLRYSVKDADSWTEVTGISATNHTLTGLSTANTYEVQVKAVCGVGSESAWTASAEFTPVCNAPTALAVTARTQNSATFSWTSTETAWKLQYKAEGEADWNEVNVATNPFTLTGLNAGTSYQAKIQSACGSAFTDAVSFTTWCDSKLSLPVNETSFSAIPACWEESPAGAITISSNKLCFIGEGERFLYLPLSDINLNLLSVTLTFSGSLELGYISEPNGAFTQLVAAPVSGTEYDLASLAPEAAKSLAIRYNGASSLTQSIISAVKIRRTPGCAKLDAPTATPGVGSATIEWTAGSESAWNLQYKLASAADWTDATGTIASPFVLSGLEQGVSYKVRVQADCGGGDLGDWSNETTFTTDCDAIDPLPYIADFSVALSNCWTIYAEDEIWYKPAANTAMNQLMMNGGKDGASNNVVVLPLISADLSAAVLSLEYKNQAVNANYAKLEIGYMTDKADESSFTLLGEALEQSASWAEARVALNTVPANKHLALRFAGASSHSDMSIKNLRVINAYNFADTEDNTATFEALKASSLTVDVTIGRTFVCAEYYNTICLPFSLSAAELAASPIASDDLWAFKYARVEGGELLIRIMEADHINAGEPYLIAWPAGDNIEKPLFKNVTISASAGKVMGEEDLKFVGTLKPEAFAAHDDTKLFLYTNNTLYWWDGASDSHMNSFRAYFYVEGGAGSSTIKNLPARIVKEDKDAMDVENVQGEGQAIKRLENDQVVIIRNGVKYSIQGQKIQ